MEHQGTRIDPNFHKKDSYDDDILPILENPGGIVVKEEPKEKLQERKEPEKSIFDDYYGFFISSILAALIGYLIFGNQTAIKFYGNFFAGFFEPETETISMRGTIIQIILVFLLHVIITQWLL